MTTLLGRHVRVITSDNSALFFFPSKHPITRYSVDRLFSFLRVRRALYNTSSTVTVVVLVGALSMLLVLFVHCSSSAS